MSVQEMRAALHKMVDEADEERLVLLLHGWEVEGDAGEIGVSREEYNRDVDRSLEEYASGGWVSNEEVMAKARRIIDTAQ